MRYLYYKLWKDFTGKVTDSTPAIYSMIWISVIQSINIITLILLFCFYFEIEYQTFSTDYTVLYSIIISLLVMGLNYFRLFKKKELIYKRFISESRLMSIIGYLILYFYMIGSFVFAYIASTIIS